MQMILLAEMQLQKQSKDYNFDDVINTAKKIRKWINKHPTITKAILTNNVTPQQRYKYAKKGITV